MKCSVLIATLFIVSSLSPQKLPIKPTRTISFTTTEGSYMDVDISPDGNTIVFDILGDIYTVPVYGGAALQLTRGIAFNRRPVFSPNGKSIAYISDISGSAQLNVMNISGRQNVTWGQSDPQSIISYNFSNLQWFPDGNSISVGRYIYNFGGRKGPNPKGAENIIGFSPDGKYLYDKITARNSIAGDSVCVYKQTRATGDRMKLLSISEASKPVNIAISPDENWIIYTTEATANKLHSDLIGQNIVTGQIKLLVAKIDSRRTMLEHYAFSVDSKELFIGYGGRIHRIHLYTGVDKIVPFTAKVNVDCGPFNCNTYNISLDSLDVRYTRSANLSPDGKHLVFSALNRLYIMAFPNGKPHPLVDQPVNQFQPIYSPDGKWIAYVSWSDTAGGHLWRIPATGGNPEQLDRVPGHYQRPAWSPDGRLIAVIRGKPKLGDRDNSEMGQLQIISVNDHNTNVVSDTVPLWNQLSFSPDGNRIVFMPYKELFPKTPQIPVLVSKRLDGTDLLTLATSMKMKDLQAMQQISLSPDGKYIAFSYQENLYIVPAYKGGATILFDKERNTSSIRFAAGVDLAWKGKGKLLTWSYGNMFYEVNPENIISKISEKSKGFTKPRITDSIDGVSDLVSDRRIKMKVTVPRSFAKGYIALCNVRIITMDRNKVIESGTVLIHNGRIRAIGKTADINIPKGTWVVDLPGKTIIPGFVDLHDHMRVSPDIFPQQSWMFLANLAFGVTTARDPSSSYDAFGYSELLETGQMIGPRLFSVGRSVRPEIEINNLENAKDLVRKRKALGATTIKQYDQNTRIQRQWLLLGSREAGLNMTNEGQDMFQDIAMIKDGSTGVEHARFLGVLYNDVISFLAKSGAYLTPTLQATAGITGGAGTYFHHLYRKFPDTKVAWFAPPNYYLLKSIMNEKSPSDTLHPDFVYESNKYASIRKLGGRVALGSHGNDQGIGVHNELWALQMGGMSNLEALQTATIVGAEGLGIQKDLGSIEKGKVADLVILNSNPLEDIHNSRDIKYIMKDGVLYDGDTLDILWPVVKKMPEWRPGISR